MSNKVLIFLFKQLLELICHVCVYLILQFSDNEGAWRVPQKLYLLYKKKQNKKSSYFIKECLHIFL